MPFLTCGRCRDALRIGGAKRILPTLRRFLTETVAEPVG